MKIGIRFTSLAVLAAMATAVLAPSALADSRQKNKNDWRNLAGVGAAVTGYGLLRHDRTATLVGAAGAGYSAYRYEKDRHSQSQQSAARRRYYRTHPSRYYYRTYRRTVTHRYYHRRPTAHRYYHRRRYAH